MFKRILVPTDFSDKCTQAVEIAIRLALEDNAIVHILHVIEIISDTTFDEFESFYTKLEKRAQKNMDKLIAPVKVKPVEIESNIVYGNRVQEILSFSHEHEIDLIVLNSHKIDFDDPSQGWGTISYKVGILSQCPVMLVK
jgi:universal stress protein A